MSNGERKKGRPAKREKRKRPRMATDMPRYTDVDTKTVIEILRPRLKDHMTVGPIAFTDEGMLIKGWIDMKIEVKKEPVTTDSITYHRIRISIDQPIMCEVNIRKSFLKRMIRILARSIEGALVKWRLHRKISCEGYDHHGCMIELRTPATVNTLFDICCNNIRTHVKDPMDLLDILPTDVIKRICTLSYKC